MREFSNEFNMIAATQSRSLKSTIFPDHPHPTMLVEGGQEPGNGTGWKSVEIKKISERDIRKGKYKAKQKELDQVGRACGRLSIEDLVAFDDRIFEQSFVRGLPDLILIAPNDEGRSSCSPRLGWTRRLRQSAVLRAALGCCFDRSDVASAYTITNNLTTKEVPL